MSQIFLLPMTDYAPTIRFKTAALVMALEQRILSCITCCRFQILQSENASWLLHCLAKMCWRAGNKNREKPFTCSENTMLTQVP